MVLQEKYQVFAENIFTKDYVDLSFRFKIISMPQTLEEDANFPYEDEIFLVNIGETDKFESSMIYQSKFTVLKEGEDLIFNGYSPDFCRKSDIIRDGAGNTHFQPGEYYSVTLRLSKYRCYVEIDGGKAKTSYGNGREGITDVAFYARKGVQVELDENSILFSERDYADEICDEATARFVRDGFFCNYLFWHNAPDGVYFDRLNIIQNILCTTRNSPAYQTNVEIDVYSDARRIGMTFEVTDLPTEEWPLIFAFFINGERQPAQEIKVRKNGVYSLDFCVPQNYPECNRLTIVFPSSAAVAVQNIRYDRSARFAAVKKNNTAYFFGDSITEGSECFDPGDMFVNQITRAYDLYAIDQAVSGRTFSDYTILGDYPRRASYVFIACGTNSFCGGTQEKDVCFAELEKQMETVISQAERCFPDARIIALLPIWRSDEQGVNFTLCETSEKMRAVYARHPRITVIDCYGFVPHEDRYFSNSELALHPNSAGHRLYGENLLKCLHAVIGEPPARNDAEVARRILNQNNK